MEERIFPEGAVASLLEQNFVEARIHSDHGEKGYQNRQLQQKLVGYPANPYYVVIDANTGLKLGQHVLAGAQSEWAAGFEAFLREMLAQAR